MRLLVMRHGPAEAESAALGDFARRLSAIGRRHTTVVAEALRARGERPSRILASPLVRARETADLVAAVLGSSLAVETHDDLAPGEDATELVQALVRTSMESALLVSHSPDVSRLAGSLLGVPVGGFDAAMVLALDVDASGAVRRFVLRPSELGGESR